VADSTFGAYAVQKDAGGFLGNVLRDKFATERFGEDSFVKVVDELAGAGLTLTRGGRSTPSVMSW
jgi:hypothetical protein